MSRSKHVASNYNNLEYRRGESKIVEIDDLDILSKRMRADIGKRASRTSQSSVLAKSGKTVVYHLANLVLSLSILAGIAGLGLLASGGLIIIVIIPITIIFLAYLSKIDELYFGLGRRFMELELDRPIFDEFVRSSGLLDRIELKQMRFTTSLVLVSLLSSSLSLGLLYTVGYIAISVVSVGFNPVIQGIVGLFGYEVSGGQIFSFSGILQTMVLVNLAIAGILLLVLVIFIIRHITNFHIGWLERKYYFQALN